VTFAVLLPTAQLLHSGPDGSAISFGGRVANGNALGSLFAFDDVHGWSEVLAAGFRPLRSASHVAVYDATDNVMLVALGMEANGALVNLKDLWSLDLQLGVSAGAWTCLAGAAAVSGCLAEAAELPSSPGSSTFGGSVQFGGTLYVLGGLSLPGDGSSSNSCTSYHGTADLWAIEIRTLSWLSIPASTCSGQNWPNPLILSWLVLLGMMKGMKSTLMAFGGGDVSCLAAGCVSEKKYHFLLCDICPHHAYQDKACFFSDIHTHPTESGLPCPFSMDVGIIFPKTEISKSIITHREL
jgi:hypothetical protein